MPISQRRGEVIYEMFEIAGDILFVLMGFAPVLLLAGIMVSFVVKSIKLYYKKGGAGNE